MAKRKRVARKSANTKPKKKPKDMPGLSLEKAVARIQQMIDPQSQVSHNEKLTDRVGIERQYDVVLRGQAFGQPILGIIECKNHNRNEGPEAVEAFAKKTENLGANVTIIVSSKGFSKQALKLANHENISCLSLLPQDPNQTGLNLSVIWYAQIWRWDSIRMLVHWPGANPNTPPFVVQEVRYDGKPVVGWFLKELATKYELATTPGPLPVHIKFDRVVPLEIKGKTYESSGLSFEAERVCIHKRRRFRLFGEAVYDWQNDTLTIPSQGELFSEPFKGSFADWEEFDGIIPVHTNDFISLIFLCHINQFNPHQEAMDLMAL